MLAIVVPEGGPEVVSGPVRIAVDDQTRWVIGHFSPNTTELETVQRGDWRGLPSPVFGRPLLYWMRTENWNASRRNRRNPNG